VIELLLLSPMRRGRNWARIVLATVGLVSVPTFIVVRGVLAMDQPVAKDYILLGLGLQELLMLFAVVAMFLPSAKAWFRRGKVRLH
jgi:surface polysaccharide O-acyltransferase-like enzyme